MHFCISENSSYVICIFLFLIVWNLYFCISLIKVSGLMVFTLTHVIGKDSWYRHGRMELTKTDGIDMDSWYKHGLMVSIWTHGRYETHIIDSDSWYIIGTPESHTYKRAKCCPYAGFCVVALNRWFFLSRVTQSDEQDCIFPYFYRICSIFSDWAWVTASPARDFSSRTSSTYLRTQTSPTARYVLILLNSL